MKIKLPKIKASKALFSLRYFYILIFVLLLTALALLGSFLYRNFYQTIAQSEEIILLKKEVAPDIIDINKVETVLNRLNKKSSTTDDINFDVITDPFNENKVNPEINQENTITNQAELPNQTSTNTATTTP
ncbi:MAG: hypothetical protein HUU49_00900 [Candidatus Buchananbacteria bacterium]|nr:hypothetical protein [Candidatus Buchananbacteria bacterium]